MKTHSIDFKNQLTELGRELRGIITYDNITLEEEINSITPHYEADILKSVMKQLDLELSVDIPLETVINCQIGILVNGDYEMLDYGNYVVYSSEKQEDTETYKIVCYDKMLYSMKEYEELGVSYPISIKNYLTALGNKIGLNVANNIFYNQNLTIPSELYLGQNYTYRDVLDEIAQATGSIICINDNDEIEVRYTNDLTQYNQAEGTSIQITDAEEFQAKEIKIIGNSEQDGTPTPENPIEIHSTGDSGNVNEKVQNKNFLSLQDIAQTTALGLTYSVKNGKITINGTASSGGIAIPLKFPINCKNGTNYVLSKVTSGTSSNNNFNIQLRSNGVSIKQPTAQSLPVIYNDLSDTIDAIRLYVGNGYVFTNYTLELQIEQGTTATDYAPHEEQDISFPLAQGQKLMQGDYLADDGVHHVRGEYELTGNENLLYTQLNDNTFRFGILISNKKPNSTSISHFLCNIGQGVPDYYWDNDEVGVCELRNPTIRAIVFRLPLSIATNIETAKAYLAEQYTNGTPVKVQYELVTEVIDPYTEEQQAVWEQIKALRTYKPVTHISSTDEVPATVNVTYATNLEKIDEEYLKDINVTFGEMYGPVNSIVLSRSADSDNIYLQDTESVQKNGLCEIKISDNQIMNFNNRSDFLPGILEALNGLTYSINDFNSTGILYYDLGDFYYVSIGENLYKCLMLNDEINVTTGIEEIIHTDMPEKSETDYEKADKTDRRINQTYLIVDKQNQTIESVVNNVTEQNNKISQITQTVDEINSKISDIADITTYGESDRAGVELLEINESEPIMIKVHPTSENISYLYPRENLYPSDLQYLPNRIIRFTRTYEENEQTLTENIDYELPDDLLRYSDTVYDEFYLDYESTTCQVIKRCAYNADGTVRALGTEITTDYPYPTIGLGDGNYTITLPGYDFGYLYVRLMAKNIYTTQFYTKYETNSQINQKADEINLGVNQTLTNYSTTNQMNSAINIKANEITSTVSSTYETKSNAQSKYSQLQQTDSSISSTVATKVGENEIISKINQSAEAVTINAGKINLNGAVTANQNFKIKTDGSMEAKNGTFTGGSISLTGGTIDNPRLQVVSSSSSSTKASIAPDAIRVGSGRTYLSFASGILNIINNNSSFQMLASSSRINAGVDNFYVSGTVHANAYNYDSLESLKKNIKKYDKSVLDIIKNAEIYEFNFKTEDDKTSKHIGFIIPDEGGDFYTPNEVIAKDGKGIDAYNMASILWKAVQEQQEQIEQMKKEIKELKGGNE